MWDRAAANSCAVSHWLRSLKLLGLENIRPYSPILNSVYLLNHSTTIWRKWNRRGERCCETVLGPFLDFPALTYATMQRYWKVFFIFTPIQIFVKRPAKVPFRVWNRGENMAWPFSMMYGRFLSQMWRHWHSYSVPCSLSSLIPLFI